MSFSPVCRASPGLSVWCLAENRLLPPNGDSTLPSPPLNREGFVTHLGGSLQLTLRYPNALRQRGPEPGAGGGPRKVSRERADLSKEWLPVKFNDRTGFGKKKKKKNPKPSAHHSTVTHIIKPALWVKLGMSNDARKQEKSFKNPNSTNANVEF